MRTVFVNHCHPATPHVCATRMREFAAALAALGHEGGLLTEVLDGQTGSTDIGKKIRDHDFKQPLYVAIEPKRHPMIKRLRERSLPAGLRQAVVVWHYFKHKGVFTDWRTGSQSAVQEIAEHFKPDLVWASFGNTDCWNIARDLAKIAACPWVADLKDLWSNFIPAPFQKFLSRHFDDCAALTTFSEFHSKDARRWFSAAPHVIYSGFPGDALTRSPDLPSEKQRTICLTGAIYDQVALGNLMAGIRSWVLELDEQTKADLHLVYAGHDCTEVEQAASMLAGLCKVDIKGYLPIEELREIQQSAIANLYIKNDSTFHHKTIEMLSSGRPLICYPAETEEAIEIAGTTNVPLHSCTSPGEIATALQESLNFIAVEVMNDAGLQNFTWEVQVQKLADLFQNVLDRTENKIHAQ